jgi:hypothetical protein
MADPSDDEKFDKGQEKQTIAGQQSHRSEYGNQVGESTGQPIGGNDSATGSGTTLSQAEFGGQSATGEAQGSGAEPPRSMGTRGSEFGQFGDATGPAGQQGQSGTGQADLGSQADTTLAGRSDQQDLNVDQPGSVGGASGSAGEGFIGTQGSGSDEYLQRRENPASADTTGGSDFAPQGRGATEGEGEEEDDGGEGHPA